MSDIDYAIYRLTAWLRDYGPEKSPRFVKDVAIAMDAAKEAAHKQEEIERLLDDRDHYFDVARDAIEERDEARKVAHQLFQCGGPFMLGTRRLWLEKHPWLESEVSDV